MPGYYNPNAPITTVTDADGDYSFNGLAAGNYGVVEIEPQGSYINGITKAGSTGGVVIGPYTQTGAVVLAGLTVPAPHDAILQVVITPGQTSISNNFSVVQTQLIYLIQPPPIGRSDRDAGEHVRPVFPALACEPAAAGVFCRRRSIPARARYSTTVGI